MATNDFLPFATGAGANVLAQTDYAALPAVSTGYQSGIAKSQQLNKTWRQSSIMAAVLAQFISDQTGANSTDDGTTATLLANLKKSMPGRLLGVQTFSASGTYTPGTYNGITATRARFRFVGGGGGGGGVSTANSSQAAAANGGNGGEYIEAFVVSGLTSQSITIGNGGNGGAAGFNNGTQGGSTVVGSVGTAVGGLGGSAGGAGAPPYINTGQANNGGGVPSGSIVFRRGCELGGAGLAVSLTYTLGGNGGNTPFSAGFKGGAAPVAGSYGCGGGGAAIGAGGAAQAGQNGYQGFVIVEEYA